MSDHLLLLALGPVQSFISAARRSRDLWSGSWLLSEISKAAAKALQDGGALLIFPAPGSDLSPGSEFSVGNKVQAVLEKEDEAAVRALMETAKQAARNRFRAGVHDSAGVVAAVETAVIAESETGPVKIIGGIVVIIAFERGDIWRRWRSRRAERLGRIIVALPETDHLAVHEALIFFPVYLAPQIVAALHIDDGSRRNDNLRGIFDAGAPAQVHVCVQGERRGRSGTCREHKCRSQKCRVFQKHERSSDGAQ